MEKVQVDARKLQLLNDRINQTIDALNQLRMTTQNIGFGIGHSTYAPVAQQLFPFGAPVAQNFPPTAWPSVYGAGFTHSSPVPGLGVPGVNPALAGLDPIQAVRQAELMALATRGISSPVGFGGLGHSYYPTGRSPAAEVILGAYDPIARQMEYARATEANRAWEIAQGLAHTTNASVFGGLPLGSPYTVGFGPQTPFGMF